MAILISPSPFTVFVTRGARYTADANSIVVATSPTDIQDLITAGCEILGLTGQSASVPSAEVVVIDPLTGDPVQYSDPAVVAASSSIQRPS
jgi:hypothetical protein